MQQNYFIEYAFLRQSVYTVFCACLPNKDLNHYLQPFYSCISRFAVFCEYTMKRVYCSRQKQGVDVFFRAHLQHPVAGDAPAERPDPSGKSIPIDNLPDLLDRAVGTDAAPEYDPFVHEKAPVACQEDPAFRFHDVEHFEIVAAGKPGGIESEEPESTGGFAEMDVCDES